MQKSIVMLKLVELKTAANPYPCSGAKDKVGFLGKKPRGHKEVFLS